MMSIGASPLTSHPHPRQLQSSGPCFNEPLQLFGLYTPSKNTAQQIGLEERRTWGNDIPDKNIERAGGMAGLFRQAYGNRLRAPHRTRLGKNACYAGNDAEGDLVQIQLGMLTAERRTPECSRAVGLQGLTGLTSVAGGGWVQLGRRPGGGCAVCGVCPALARTRPLPRLVCDV